MTTIFNNAPPSTDSDSDSGFSFIIGAVVVLIIVVLFLVFGLPTFWDNTTEIPVDNTTNTTNTTNNSSSTINIQLPATNTNKI